MEFNYRNRSFKTWVLQEWFDLVVAGWSNSYFIKSVFLETGLIIELKEAHIKEQ